MLPDFVIHCYEAERSPFHNLSTLVELSQEWNAEGQHGPERHRCGMIRRCIVCSLLLLLLAACDEDFAATATPEMLGEETPCPQSLTPESFMMVEAVQVRIDLGERGISTDFVRALGFADCPGIKPNTVALFEIGIQVAEEDDLDVMGGWIVQIVAATAQWPDSMIHLSFMVNTRERSRLEFNRSSTQHLIEQGLVGADLLATVSGNE